MIDRKHCIGCHDNYYNCQATSGSSDGMCWSRKTGKMVWRIPVGYWENPPYLNKKKVKVPDCWHGQGSNRTHYIKPEVLDSRGYWKW